MSQPTARLWEQVRALELQVEHLQSLNAQHRATLESLHRRAGPSLAASSTASVAHVSHELRAPLAAMLGYVDVLLEQMQRQAAPDEWRTSLETVRHNGQNLLQRIDCLLQPLKPSAAAHPSGVTLRGRLLLVDDVPDTRQLMAILLSKAGAQVLTANDGRAACEAALAAMQSGDSFDLILMDMEMPVLNGYDACQELRAAGYRGPIVAVTAHDGPEHRNRCLAVGCDDCLFKPFSSPQMLELVARYLSPR